MAELLEAFHRAGVLTPGDVRVARTLGVLGDEPSPEVLLGAALAVRAPRHGHVCVELAHARQRIAPDPVDEAAEAGVLPWPDLDAWGAELVASPLVRGTDELDGVTPLVLADGRLYLDRYWRYQQGLAEELRRRGTRWRDDVVDDALRRGLARLFPDEGPAASADRQRIAAALAVLRSLTVISGGPGTGKTSTVARILALLHLQPADRPLRVALAAPTGKAAARLGDAVRTELAELDLPADVAALVGAASASTLHRLLGVHPASATRFRHDAQRPVPYDVVVVDEASMVSLSLMAKLVDAVAPEARLLLLGDRDQLASVEAGAALGDLCGPLDGSAPLCLSQEARARLAAVTGVPTDVEPADRPGVWDGIVVLDHFWRFGEDSGIGEVARAIQRVEEDAGEVLGLLADDRFADVELVDHADTGAVHDLQADVVAAYGAMARLAVDGAPGEDVLEALDHLRVLCAVRGGPDGVEAWNTRITGWLADTVDGLVVDHRWYVGRPVLVLENDHASRLYNGDVGVVVRDPSRPGREAVAFPGTDGPRLVNPSRLPRCETTFAMTVHKSQGSQFGHALVVLPRQPSPILTRELVYTGITRARERATLLAGEDVLRQALRTPVQRASGLRSELWS